MDDVPTQGNIPISLSTFIGRKRESAEVDRLLTDHRLLTLTGPGGCGKTRLALEVARDKSPRFPDGAWWAEFASLTKAELVPQAVAASLEVQEKVGRPVLDVLVEHIRSRGMLFLLDNCEHLAQACAQLSAALLAECPGIHILATSREPLGVQGEVVLSVPPLSLPEPQPWRRPGSEKDTLETYLEAEAIQLFIERAREASPAFKLDAQNGPWVADICRRLDGIPLAIELAAARLRAFSVRQIAERLDDRFQLLTSSLRTAPERHQTLEATLEWSYALLSEAEQNVLQRLSVFSAGWTLDAAQQVCAYESLHRTDVMHVLANLVDKSLVVADGDRGGRRYRLLETIRQYAHQKLVESESADAARDRHLEHYLSWAEAAAPRLAGPEQQVWLDRFDHEHDNIRAALDYCLQKEERAEEGLRLTTACAQFWRLRSSLSEGRARLSTALSLTNEHEQTLERAWALLWSANLAYLQSDYQTTRTCAQKGLEICRELGPDGRPGVARAHDLLGELATEVGDYESAPVHLRKALGIYRELEDKRGIADMLLQLGWAEMRQGAYDEADALLNECLPLLRDLDETMLLAFVLSGLGELEIRRGRLDQAKNHLQESLSLRLALGERWGVAASLGSLGWVALLRREFGRMKELLQESMAIRTDIGDRGGIAWCLEKLAQSRQLQARALPSAHRGPAFRQAAQLLGAASALRASVHSVVDPADQAEYEQLQENLRRSLGGRAFDDAWVQGSDVPLEQVVDLALSPTIEPSDAEELTVGQVEKIRFGGLTRREREAAGLIAQGKTNREIAQIMVVRVKTIETYVTRILNKLGFNSRVHIATWALEVGLTDHREDTPTS